MEVEEMTREERAARADELCRVLAAELAFTRLLVNRLAKQGVAARDGEPTMVDWPVKYLGVSRIAAIDLLHGPRLLDDDVHAIHRGLISCHTRLIR